MGNVQRVETLCFLTTDGNQFLNRDEAIRHQQEINIKAWMDEYGAYGQADFRSIIMGAEDLIKALNVGVTI